MSHWPKVGRYDEFITDLDNKESSNRDRKLLLIQRRNIKTNRKIVAKRYTAVIRTYGDDRRLLPLIRRWTYSFTGDIQAWKKACLCTRTSHYIF